MQKQGHDNDGEPPRITPRGVWSQWPWPATFTKGLTNPETGLHW